MPKRSSPREVSATERRCTVKDCDWTYREYGIKKNGGKTWYVWWYCPVEQDTLRHSLYTTELNLAIEKVINYANGIDEKYLGGDPIVYDIVLEFVNTFPKELPPLMPAPEGTATKPWMRSQRKRLNYIHRLWTMMEPTFAALLKNTKISKLTPALQHEVLDHLASRGYKVSSISTMASLWSRAFTWAAEPDMHNIIKSKFRPEIIRKGTRIAKIVRQPRPKADNYAPKRDELVKLLLAFAADEPVRRWFVLMLAFGCRVEAAAEATSAQLVDGVFHLNPDEREEVPNKIRPSLPVAWSALQEIQSWGDGDWVALSADSIGERIRKVRLGLDLPRLKASSIRDYIATMLRVAHVHYGCRKIDKEERRLWQGHAFERDDTNDKYGEYLPEFYLRSKVATEAMMRDLDFRTGGLLFRQGPDKTPLSVHASLEDPDKSGLLGANPDTELPQETSVFIGPKRAKTGVSGPHQGTFRQVSGKVARHPDGTVDALNSFGMPSVAERLAKQGVVLYEATGQANTSDDQGLYLVAGGSNLIPAASAGTLRQSDKPAGKLKASEIDEMADTLSKAADDYYEFKLRAFELEMTRLYADCVDDEDRASLDFRFDRELPFIVGPIICALEEPFEREEPDFSDWTDEALGEHADKQAAERKAKIASGEWISLNSGPSSIKAA
ncbi:hypothetical protein [Methylobacterium sp. 77]|uniref:hypothetical protein n=1 Tax=Methylobacterium sp. 77 TaxID=1101192 RepID=UPI00039C4F16|nr:hypothetical protein [Methylobacterium sp. 77]